LRITADTNVLVRAAALDDPAQSSLALDLLRNAELIAVTLPALCEFAWVLRQGYHWSGREVFGMIKTLVAGPTVQVDRPAVEAGLALLEAGGDFADGVIAFEGRRLGGTVFASFDRRVTELIAANSGEIRLLGDNIG
jgi:predicted nucleic-acid-binding protein